jgi:hypothetical protein
MVWDPIRQKEVAATPEEGVRQQLILKMIALGYPRGLISVEKQIPGRRFDLVCYRKINEQLLPLLLVECKAGKLTAEAEKQVFGYNHSVGAPFVCLANESEIKTLWHQAGKIASIPFLPTYNELLSKL